MPKADIKFIHMREYDAFGYMAPNGGRTIAFRLDTTNNQVVYAVAKVNKIDRYVRATGRAVAEAHLNAGNNLRILNMDALANYITDLTPNAVAKLRILDVDGAVVTDAIVDEVVAHPG